MTPQAANPSETAPVLTTHLYLGIAGVLLGATVATLYIALDQGQRLDWYHSSLILELTVSGVFLVLVAVIRRFLLPNPLINYRFLLRSNALPLAPICFRFVMLATIVSIPSFLGSVKDFLPLQESSVPAWVAVPQFILGVAAMALMRKIDPRLILTAGFSLVAIACFMNARVISVWAGPNFGMSQAVMAIGLSLALTRPADILTFAGFFQVTRLFGGEMGATFMGHFIPVHEQLHTNIFGLSVQLGNTLTDNRLLGLCGAFAHYSTGLRATVRAAEVLALQVRQQGFTLAIADSFVLSATCCVACLVVVAFMSAVPTQYHQIIASSAKGK